MIVNSLQKNFYENLCNFLSRDGGPFILGVIDKWVVIGLQPVTAPLFEELSDRFSATIPLPGKGTAPEVTPEVISLLQVLNGEMSRREIMSKLGLADEKHFRKHYQQRAVKAGLIELTIPEKPTSRLQKYRLTRLGRAVAEKDRKS